ncbi:MAG: LysR family transcriptional regulator [Bryobacterales bacterium]|nr:LysR family transcriptional regulator [Bryobacterales bacterium]
MAELLNFSRAAEKLRVAQPALSRQIRALEDELGAPLFEREHGVQLTDAGRVFRVQAEKILAQVDTAVAAVHEVTAGAGVGELIVCNDWRLAAQFVPAVMAEFQKQFPRVEVTLRDLRFHDQLAALRARRAHLGFVVRNVLGRVGELETLLVLRARLMVVVPAKHARAKEREVSLADLATDKWVILDEKEAPGYRAFITQVARISGFTPRFATTAVTFEGLLGRVAMGYGVALVVESNAPLHNPLLRCLATDIEPLELCAVWHRREKSRLLHAFLEIVRAQANRAGAPAAKRGRVRAGRS